MRIGTHGRIGLLGLLLAAAAACDQGAGHGPEEAQPFDTIAPAPEAEIVPGSDSPGPDENRP